MNTSYSGMLLHVFVLVVCYQTTYTANVLTASSVPGSHYFATKVLSELLAEHGHNVTFISASRDTRVTVDPRIRYIAPDEGSSLGFHDTEAYLEEIGPYLAQVMRDNKNSENMGPDFMNNGDDSKLTMKHNKVYMDFFTSPGILHEIQNSTKFDVIIAEEHAFMPLATITYQSDIPLVILACASEMKFTRMREKLPYLMASEPGMIGSIPAHSVPTFLERLYNFMSMLKVMTFYFGKLGALLKEYIHQFGVPEELDLEKNVVMTIVNDHPAVSFPYLTPPNVLYLGGLHLVEKENLKPLPKEISDFMEACSQPNIIYVSFGSYLYNLTDIGPWFPKFLKYLPDLDACIIFKAKSGVDRSKLDENKILVVPWVPQKELLASGKVTMFISHCGNNGRLEAIYYTVPLLCIPLFADQLHNAYYVTRHRCGTYLFRENLTKESFLDAVNNVIENKDEIKRNQARAAYIMKNDPGVGTDMVLFYIDLLAKYGNLHYLKNRVIEKQWTYEVWNLDVVIILLIFGLLILGFVGKCSMILFRVSIKMLKN